MLDTNGWAVFCQLGPMEGQLWDTTYHVQAASRAFFANKQILCDKKVRFAVRLRFFDRVITPVALFASGHRTIRMSDLYKLDVVFRKMLRMIVGPPSFVDWNAPWLEILHHWNGKAVALAQQHGVNPWSEQCLKHHWKFAMHVANLPSNRWVKRVLLWNPCGARTRGYPRHVWTSKLVAYTRFHQLGCIEAMGMNYGLRLNWRNARYCLLGAKLPSQPLTEVNLICKSSISYLGSYLDATGAGGPEICRRSKVNSTNWRESGGILPCTPQQKIRIFQACVVSKLLYCLHTMWLNKAKLRKIDGFQAKCLRSILHIPPSYISRVSNATVLQRSQCNACPPSWNSDSYVSFNPLQCYLMMMSADDAFSTLVALFCKNCQLHAAGVAPNKYGLPKCIEWQWKLLKVLTC